jgi:hypothetical protein
MALPLPKRVELGHCTRFWGRNNYPQWSSTRPCRDLCCAFAVEGHGNDGLSLIGGKVAALAVMIDAIPALWLGPLWLVRVVTCSFSFLHAN